MGLVSAVALYFVFWWIAFYVVLAFGNRDPDPEHARVGGTERGAPSRHHLPKRVLWTSLIAALMLATLIGVLNSGITLADIPLPSPPGL